MESGNENRLNSSKIRQVYFDIIALQYASYLSPNKLFFYQNLKFDGCVIVQKFLIHFRNTSWKQN